MKLTKQTKTLIGVGVLGVAAYLIWKQNQDKQNFSGFNRVGSRNTLGRPRAKNPIFSMTTGETMPTNPFDKTGTEASFSVNRNPCGCAGVGKRSTYVANEKGYAICTDDSSGVAFGCKDGEKKSYFELVQEGVLRF